MAKATTVRVGYPPDSPDTKQWDVPRRVYEAGMAKDWIEDQIASETDRAERKEAAVNQELEREFQTVRKGLGELQSLRQQIVSLEQTVSAYESADRARQSELAAVKSAQSEVLGVGNDAVATTRDLSLATTGAAEILDRLRTTMASVEDQLALAWERINELLNHIESQVEDARKTGQTRQRLEQEASNRLIGALGALEARVAKAEVTAQNALTTATAAERSNQNGNDLQKAADQGAKQAMADWETSSDTATIRKLLGTDHRSLAHMQLALETITSDEIGGVPVQEAKEVAVRLLTRIAEAQDFRDSFGVAAADSPDTSDGTGKAAPPRSKRNRRQSK